MKNEKLTLIVPVYNEQKTLDLFYNETERILKDIDIMIEYLFIDDGSKDNSLKIIHKLADTDKRIHYISFSRNFGKEAAIYAGLKNAAGDYITILDADLQDPPSLIPKMLDSVIEEGYDCVGTRRVNRKGEPPIRSFFARIFYKLINKISKTEIVDGARDFQLINKKVANAILSMNEYNRFSKGIFGWVGFRKKWIEYENIERAAGETKWSFWKLFLYAVDGIVAFSTMPLVLSSFLGILFCMIAFIMILLIITKTLIFGDPTSGWPSLVCIIMLVSGVQLFCIGILGQYLSKTYLETKKRPIYLIEEAKLEDKELSKDVEKDVK